MPGRASPHEVRRTTMVTTRAPLVTTLEGDQWGFETWSRAFFWVKMEALNRVVDSCCYLMIEPTDSHVRELPPADLYKGLFDQVNWL